MAIFVEAVLCNLDRAGHLNTVPRDLQDILQADQSTRHIARILHV